MMNGSLTLFNKFFPPRYKLLDDQFNHFKIEIEFLIAFAETPTVASIIPKRMEYRNSVQLPHSYGIYL
uniref:Maturase K n=1 Tax=Romanomermis culicivorax TaxID=13658 RepID=A0A915JJR4_ROMCU